LHCCQLRGYRLSLFPQPFFGLFQRCRWKLYSGLMFATRTYVSFNKLPKSHRFAWVGHLAAAVMAACTVHSPLSHWPLTTHPEVPEANLHLQHVSDWQPACVLCMCAGCYSRHKMPQVLQVRTSHGRSRDTLSLDVVGSLDAFSCRAGSRRVAPGRAGSRLDLLVFALQELLEVSDSLLQSLADHPLCAACAPPILALHYRPSVLRPALELRKGRRLASSFVTGCECQNRQILCTQTQT